MNTEENLKPLTKGKEYLLVSFWNLNEESNQFECVHYFLVPSPHKIFRTYTLKKHSQNWNDDTKRYNYTVLFKGRDSEGKHDELFLLFNDEEDKMRVGIINLNPEKIDGKLYYDAAER